MISAIVIAPAESFADATQIRTQEAVVRSLSALVGAAIADLVRDACIVGPPDHRLGAIADHAGCGLVEDVDAAGALARALRSVRSERVLLLRAGYAPMSGFIDEMSDWIAAVASRPAALRCEAGTLAQRLFPGLAPTVGVVARAALLSSAGGADPQAIARAIKAGALRTRARKVV